MSTAATPFPEDSPSQLSSRLLALTFCLSPLRMFSEPWAGLGIEVPFGSEHSTHD